MNDTSTVLLASVGLRTTQPRRAVLRVLSHKHVPHAPQDVWRAVRRSGQSVNLVTVYRILRQLQEVGIVHLHPTTGKYVLCTAIGDHACHSFLTCEQCGNVEELHDEQLCAEEHRIAKKAGFAPRYHVSDVVGICAHCQ